MALERLLHECLLRHSWLTFILNGVYENKSTRFCLECLEQGRIEVASIFFEDSAVLGALPHLYSRCKTCGYLTPVLLIPDWRGFALLDKPPDLFVEHDQWYHLPQRWPECYRCLERT